MCLNIFRNFMSKLISYLNVRKGLKKKIGKLWVYRNTNLNIHQSASLRISTFSKVNTNWGGNLRNKADFSIGESASFICNGFSFFDGTSVYVSKEAKLKVGSGYMSGRGLIVCRNSIEIGEDVAIADEVIIRDSDDHIILREGYQMTAPVRIGNHVWIGTRAVILKGAKIGDGCIVAAGSLVTKSFPDNCLIGGVPAKIIKENISWK